MYKAIEYKIVKMDYYTLWAKFDCADWCPVFKLFETNFPDNFPDNFIVKTIDYTGKPSGRPHKYFSLSKFNSEEYQKILKYRSSNVYEFSLKPYEILVWYSENLFNIPEYALQELINGVETIGTKTI